MEDIVVSHNLSVPSTELRWRFSRSGGPGGQHVNTSSTKVELSWDLAASEALGETQRARLLANLAGRVDEAGVLRLVVEETRSQHRNREIAVERLRALLIEAVKPRKKRRPTRPTRASKERRLQAKRVRGERKQDRRKDW
ncbi:MAG: aminoacyl-tRNA hydrolase [Caldilineae bacterium]|nr:aminoacyl-tRNA hydrolase [Chloroflexota bacterium]MCB9175810.1 aminoacyl-tRNA hydrolase [Caldilineae bacterium]